MRNDMILKWNVNWNKMKYKITFEMVWDVEKHGGWYERHEKKW